MTDRVQVVKDVERSRLTLTTVLDATPERAWRLWSTADGLARWWGPPGQAMTVTRHELAPGGDIEFFVTSPAGERRDGRFDVHVVEPPRRLDLTFHAIGFGSMAVGVVLTAVEPGRTQMAIVISFATADLLARALEIGFDAGVRRSVARASGALAEMG